MSWSRRHWDTRWCVLKAAPMPEPSHKFLTHQDLALRNEADGRPMTDDHHGEDRLLEALIRVHPIRHLEILRCEAKARLNKPPRNKS